MVRSIEADALVSWTKFPSVPPHNDSTKQYSVEPILAELGISDLKQSIQDISTLNAFDVLKLTEVELVEKCRVPRMAARMLRRRALQLVKEHRGSPREQEGVISERTGAFDILRSHNSFGESPRMKPKMLLHNMNTFTPKIRKSKSAIGFN